MPAFHPLHVRTEAWSVWVDHPAPGVLQTRLVGLLDERVVHYLMDGFDQVAQQQAPVVSFHDWEEVSGYTPEAREVYVSWAKGHREQVQAVNILVHSSMVALAISVANLALGGYLHAYNDREEFEMLRARTVERVLAR